jgi:hypothetical protein
LSDQYLQEGEHLLVPIAPAESRPPYVTGAAENHRWNLAVAIAPQILGPVASPGELWFLARYLYNDPDLPTD